MKSVIVKAMIIGSTFGSLICGATTTVMASEVSKETKVQFKVDAKNVAPSYDLKVKDVDDTQYGQTIKYYKEIDGYGAIKSSSNLVEVNGVFATDKNLVDISVERTDDMGEGKIPELFISPYGIKSKPQAVGKDKVILFSGVSGKSYKSPGMGDNENQGYTSIYSKFNADNFKEGTYTAQLKWTLTPHL